MKSLIGKLRISKIAGNSASKPLESTPIELPCSYNYRDGWSGVVGSHEVVGKNTRQEVTLPYGSIGALDSPKSN